MILKVVDQYRRRGADGRFHTYHVSVWCEDRGIMDTVDATVSDMPRDEKTVTRWVGPLRFNVRRTA